MPVWLIALIAATVLPTLAFALRHFHRSRRRSFRAWLSAGIEFDRADEDQGNDER